MPVGCVVYGLSAGVSLGLAMSTLEKFVYLCLFGFLVIQIVLAAHILWEKKLGVLMEKKTELQQEFPSITICALEDDDSDVDMSMFSQIQPVENKIISITYPHWNGTQSVMSLFSTL